MNTGRKTIKRILVIVLAVLTVSVLPGCGNKTLKVGTGSKSGVYYDYMKKFDEVTGDGLKLKIQTTAGSAANVRLLHNGFLDAAIVQSDILYGAKTGTGAFEGCDPITDASVSAISALYTESLHIVVREDSDIQVVDDLRGRRVSVGEGESGVLQNAMQILEIHGIKAEDITPEYLSYSEAAKKLKTGEIDAFFCIAGTPAGFIGELAKETPIRLLDLNALEIRRSKNLYPFYVDVVIPADTYQGVGETHTVGVRAVLVVSGNVSNEDAEKLVRCVFEHSTELKGCATDKEIDATFATEYVTIPFHPGAAAYLRSQGADVEENGTNTAWMVFGGQDE